MVKQKSGRVVNVSSEAALKGEASLAAYSASKAGVVRLTEAISEEYRMDGITANCVLPRIIDTPANRKAMPDADFSKWPKPEEIAQVILFLASDDATAVTGAAVPVIGRA
jgi:NAD(P)-dependent dehydrogenase (short-subunit alcohol dehydrogenase family)